MQPKYLFRVGFAFVVSQLVAGLLAPATTAADTENLESFDSGVAITYYKDGYPRMRVLRDGTRSAIPEAAIGQGPQQEMHRNYELDFSRRLMRGEATEGVFLGDSLLLQIGNPMRGWEPNRKVWAALAGDHAFLNAGLSADRVRNTLSKVWLIAPTARLVAIQIGTNDHRSDRPEADPAETAEGIARLVAEALHRAPKAQILLVAIPPSTRNESQIRKNLETNALIRKLAAHDRVFFVDPSVGFDPAKEDLLADGIHFTRKKGVERWYAPLIPWVRTALAGKPLPPGP
jgi:lysophospholipase L1-like esterase